jgi:hypothetical protein
LAGAASNFAAGVDKATDRKAKRTKALFGAGSKAAAGFSGTPGKTDEARVADELAAGSGMFKLVADAANRSGDGQLAAIAGRSGRLLGYSGTMLAQVPKAREGLTEASAMYDEYKTIDARVTAEVRNLERQIQQKYEEVKRLHGQGLKVQDDLRRAESKVRTCQEREATRSVKVARVNQPTQAGYAPRRTWDRRASAQRRDRIVQLKYWADQRRTPTRQVESAPPSPTVPSPAMPQRNQPSPPPVADQCFPPINACWLSYPKETVSPGP